MSLPAFLEDWPRAAQEDYQERAAILEYEAGLTREEAERQADLMTRRRWSTI